MAKFTSTADLNIRLPGGFEAIGVAGTTHRIPDSLVEEFTRDQLPFIPGFAWITQDETTTFLTSPITEADVTNLTTDLAAKYDKTGGTISGAVTATGAVSGSSLSASGAISGASVSASGAGTFGSVIAAAVTATTARFKGEPFFDIMAYGAVADGATDNAAIINSAITAAAAAGGGEVRIPAGTYAVASSVYLKSNVTVRGTGPKSVLKGTADATIVASAASDVVTGAIVEHIAIAGYGSTGTTQYGIYLDTASAVTIRGVATDNTSLSGILISSSTDCLVVDCAVSNVHGATYASINANLSTRIVIRGNRIIGGDWVGVGLQNTTESLVDGNTIRSGHSGVNVYIASHRNRIVNNDCSTSGSGITIDGNTTQANYNIVSGNHCHNNAVRGINLQNADYTQIVGNFCRSNLQNSGIYIATSNEVQVVGNFVEGNTGNGITVNAACNRSLLTGNHIRGNTLIGISVAGASAGVITGNFVYGNGQHGIGFSGTAGTDPFFAISGNIVQDNGTSATNTYMGITVQGSRTPIVGNVSVNSSTVGHARNIRINGGTNSLVVGNVTFQALTAEITDSGTGTIVQNNQTA
jgi:parallel beta-helix repeat protein